jgi:hypothetical protein
MQFARRDTHALVVPQNARRGPKQLLELHFARSHRAALCAARVVVRAAVDVAVRDKRGVSAHLL